MLVMYTYTGFTLLQFLLDYFNYGSTWLLRNLPFVVQSLGMQIMIVVLLLFLKMNIMSYAVLWKPSYANTTLYPPQNRCVKIGRGHVTWPLVT